MAVYIPPQANANVALEKLHTVVSKQQSVCPDVPVIVAGDFNHVNLKKILPKFNTNIFTPTRGKTVLDQVYTNIRGAYKAIVSPHLGLSDHASLISSYRPLISRTKPVITTIKVWSEEDTSRLRDCFDLTEWDVFTEGADLDEYTNSVLAYIDFCTETVLTTKTVRTFPNQKPWFDKRVRFLLKEWKAAFKSGDAQAYSNARRGLKTGIKEAKYRYTQRLEAQFNNNNSCSMWKAIKAITDCNGRSSHISNNPCLPDSLNCFFTRFDDQNDNGAYSEIKQDGRAIGLKHHLVRSALRRIDINKASGPDGVWKTCADQLAGVFTSMFNLSLQLAVVPTCLKSTTIIPVPKINAVECFNDFRPIALTLVITSCFERLILSHIKANIPKDLYNYQFVYRANRSTDPAVSIALHTALTHLEQPSVRVLSLRCYSWFCDRALILPSCPGFI